MAISPGTALVPEAVRDHGFHTLRIGGIVHETEQANSFVLEVPDELRPRYAYEPGQFLTFRFSVSGNLHLRCYSMSSSPHTDRTMQVSVKRVDKGLVSNFMIDTLGVGDEVEATLPSGVFGKSNRRGDVVAFAGGSGITPVISLVKSVLATTTRRVRLFYANRDAGSVMFAQLLASLETAYGDRLAVVSHLDDALGLVEPEEFGLVLAAAEDPDYYICGPAAFMDLVETSLRHHDTRGDRGEATHIERFIPSEPAVSQTGDEPSATKITVAIQIDGRSGVTEYRPGTTILQTARQMGLAPPSSCEAGSCATCMARLTQGQVRMRENNALTPSEVAEGWILTCQSVPTTPSVRVVYE